VLGEKPEIPSRSCLKGVQPVTEGALIVKEGERLVALKESRTYSNREKAKKRVRAKVGKLL
jgi:hypothetical protein